MYILPSSDDALVDLLSRVLGRLMHRGLQALRLFARQKGLSLGQMMVLRQLQFRGPCTVSDLAHGMEVTNAAASQMLDRLVAQGLVERRENPADRRSKSIALTPQGREVLEQATRWHQAWLKDVLDRLSPAEAEVLQQALTALERHLGSAPHETPSPPSA